jgi:hypothetical protein
LTPQGQRTSLFLDSARSSGCALGALDVAPLKASPSVPAAICEFTHASTFAGAALAYHLSIPKLLGRSFARQRRGMHRPGPRARPRCARGRGLLSNQTVDHVLKRAIWCYLNVTANGIRTGSNEHDLPMGVAGIGVANHNGGPEICCYDSLRHKSDDLKAKS